MPMPFTTDPMALGKGARILQALQSGTFERGQITAVGLTMYCVRTASVKDGNPVPREDWFYPHEIQVLEV